jgi:hypothetical protein
MTKKIFFVAVLKVTDEKSRIQSWIQIRQPEVLISGSGSIPKYPGSGILPKRNAE